MRYYKSKDGKQLIQFNPETKVYKVRNTVERGDSRIEPDMNEGIHWNCGFVG